ncbi:MAG: wapA 2, partial [Verrucomicrobiales bacterium]|nr:wapA 2 [Verrucomicrobiales bacterium]
IPIKFASSSNYLEFIRPVLLATTVIEDSLAVDPVTISASSGGAAEDFNFIDTGLTNGQIKISYQMFSVPDDIRIYYQGVLLYDSGLVSGSNNLVINYSGASTIVEVVMNEGNNTNSGTAWNYTVSFLAVSLAHENQRSTGVAISGNDMFISGITGASGENGIGARFGLPMQDNSHPIWELNYPELGSTRFNGVAVASDGVYMVGSSVSLTTDTVGAAEPKGIVVKFPLSHPQTNIADVYGSIWHVQTPADPGEFAISGQEELFAVTTTIETTNTFIYTAGVAQANPTNFGRMFISKLDVNGAILWTTNDATSGTTTNYSSGRAITTLNGNIYVAGGNADSGITNTYLVKYDAQGTKVWSRVSTFSGEFGGIAAYGDSIYTVGSAGTDGARSFLVQKWDESGNSIWTNQFSLNGSEDILRCVVGYADRLYAAGSTAINATNRDSVLLELSQETGALITNAAYNGITTYGGGALADDVINGIATDGFDLYLSGETHRFYTNRTDSDALLLRYRIKDDYLPEETLSLFTGEYANGDWRLVIWDNRADQVVSSGKLLSWQLQLTLAPTNNTADVLVHDVPYGATVSSKNPIRYFIVNVPFTATRATVSLTNLSGGGLNLWFDQYGLPLPGTPTRFLLLTNITAAAKNIDDSGSIPTLIPGQRFYLGVEDVGTATQDFLIQVSFDSDATTFMTGGGSAQGSFEAGFTGNNSYQFRINLSDPTMAFQLRNLTGDVDVYLQRGSIPSPSSFTFHRSFTGTNFGQILIEPQGDLSDVSGTWFVSMRNLGTNAVTYSVVLATANRAPVVEGPNDRVVTEGNLLSFIVPVADPDLPAQQMTFSLEPGAPAGASLNSTNGLFSWTPTAAQGPSSNLVTIRVTDNGVPPMTLTRSFSIIVNDKVPVFATPAVVSGKLQVTWSSLTGQNYEVQTSTNLVNWTTVATNSASGSTTTYLDPQPQTNNVNKFYRIHPVP